MIDNLQEKLEKKDILLEKRETQISELHEEVAKLRLLLCPASVPVYKSVSVPLNVPGLLPVLESGSLPVHESILLPEQEPFSYEDRPDDEAMIEMPSGQADEKEDQLFPSSSQTEEHPMDIFGDSF